MSLPVVAIVGRPNVGKSSLLNSLVGKRISIVDPTPGVTRDRVSAPCPLGGEGYVELVDTGGMGIVDVDELTGHVESQIGYAIQSAALIIFLVDAREGITTLDRHVAEHLRKSNKPVIVAANKIDASDMASEIHQMHQLGFGEPLAVSAEQRLGLTELLEQIEQRLSEPARDKPTEPLMHLAVVGKRNAGKSTFINSLAGQERVIVSETPGTTRDSVDVTIELQGKVFTLIDTAGVRKRKSLTGDIEYYGYHRSLRSIRRADVVALLIDASVPVSKVDKDLADEIVKEYKPVLIAVNKWDLAEDKTTPEDYQEYFEKVFPSMGYAPISFISAVRGDNVPATVLLAEQLFQQAKTRVSTADLNKVIGEIMALRGPSHKAGTKPPKLLYASQISTMPPTIVCFVNDVRSFDTGYQRFLLNELRQRLPFAEIPVRLLFRQRRSGRSQDEQHQAQ